VLKDFEALICIISLHIKNLVISMSKLQTKGRFFDKYLNYSVITWQLLFVDIDQQLKDYDDIKRDEDKETEAKEMIK